jgi:hypothetical protein
MHTTKNDPSVDGDIGTFVPNVGTTPRRTPAIGRRNFRERSAVFMKPTSNWAKQHGLSCGSRSTNHPTRLPTQSSQLLPRGRNLARRGRIQCGLDCFPNCPCHGWRERVTDLAVAVRLWALKLPTCREALQERRHLNRQADRSLVPRLRRFISKHQPVYLHLSPCTACPRWTEVWTAVQLRPTAKCGGDSISLIRPNVCTFPTVH